MNRCFFIGHRDTPEKIYPLLAKAIEQHISALGVQEFYVGHYGSFDAMAAKAVIAAKNQHPNVRLFMLLPYHPTIRPVELPEGFDGSFFPEGQENVPFRAAIHRANEYMIRYVDHLICYVDHPSSGSRELMDKALKRQEQGFVLITNIAKSKIGGVL